MASGTDADGGPASGLDAAIAHHQAGRLAQAEHGYAAVLEAEPAQAEALRLRGILARQRGDLRASVGYLQAAVEAAPGQAEPLCELALSLLAAGDLAGATAALRDALDAAPASHKALANLGAVLHYRGHLEEAIALYRRYLGLVPEDLEIRCNLANTLADAGLGEAALAECASALAQAPGHPRLLAVRGGVLAGLERFGEAAESLERAIDAGGADDVALINLAAARTQLGRETAALEALEEALQLNPDNARAASDLAGLLIRAGRAEAAVETCEQLLARHPGERLVVAALAYALREAGRESEAAEILDLQALVRVSELAAPSGFADLASFNRELAAVILAEGSLRAGPLSKATRGGQQTGELDVDEQPALAAFAHCINAQIEATAAAWRARGLGSHPALGPAVERWALRIWATVLEPGGQQTPHMHPLAWLSGVYYVQLPDGMAAEKAMAGALEFGAPPERLRGRVPPPVRRIVPSEGRLVVFPSYLYHRTEPFEVPGQRISLAFDVMPLAF